MSYDLTAKKLLKEYNERYSNGLWDYSFGQWVYQTLCYLESVDNTVGDTLDTLAEYSKANKQKRYKIKHR